MLPRATDPHFWTTRLSATLGAVHRHRHHRRMIEDRVTAAARVIYDAGRHHGWPGFEKPFDELEPVGMSEFLGIVERALKAAEEFDAGRPPRQS